MADKPTIPDFPTLPDFGKMITQACEVVASVRGIPYDFNGTLSLENKFVVLFKTVQEMFTAQDELVKSYKALYDFVNQYFDNLDVQTEINKKLDEMAESGQLDKLLYTFIPYGTPEMYGAKGDGITDDTEALSKALLNHDTIICRGKYFLTANKVLNLGNYGSVNYAIDLTNKELINGTFITASGCVFSVNNTHIKNATFIHNNVSTHYSSSACVASNANNINIELVTSNVPILQAFNSKYCNVFNSSFSRTSNTLPGSIIAFYNSKYCTANNNKLIGGCGDGDCGAFGISSYCTFTNNYLDAYNSKFRTKGLQGIYIDSSSNFCSVINNFLFNYYYGIDAKSDISGVLISDNTCSCKIGISVRYGETGGNNFNSIISNNNLRIGSKEDLTIIDNINNKSVTSIGILLERCEKINIDSNTFVPVDTAISAMIFERNSNDKNFIRNNNMLSYNHANNVYLNGFSIITKGDNCKTEISNCIIDNSNDSICIYAESNAIKMNNVTFEIHGGENIINTSTCNILYCDIRLSSSPFMTFTGEKVEIAFCRYINDSTNALFNTITADHSVSINNILRSTNP